MPCYHPLPGWYSRDRNPSGKRSIVFKGSAGFKDRPATVPCGSCVGCRLERSREWATRCLHEAKCWDDNCFCTLTYDDEHLPKNGSLVPEHFVDFMKRLRWHHGDGIRFFHCGEYGDDLGRPHHHVLLFNHDFDDKVYYKDEGGQKLYTSVELERLWGFGLCVIGNVTFESAGYVARYSLKKVIGPHAEAHYGDRIPEYCTMSRRPGIGRMFWERFTSDMYPSDEVIVRGKKSKPPRYYDNLKEKQAPSVMARIKSKRRAAAKNSVDNTGRRLIVRETVKEAAISNLVRPLERERG